MQTDISSQIQWYSSIDGVLGTGASVTSILSRGNHVIRAQISNPYGVAIVQQSQRLTVTGDQYPSLAIISPREGVSYKAGTVNLAASATDAEDGDISTQVQWSSNISGLLGTGNNLNIVLPAGNHTISSRITDSAGNSILVTRQITVSL